MDDESKEETKKEYITIIVGLLNRCDDFELFDLIVKLLKKSFVLKE